MSYTLITSIGTGMYKTESNNTKEGYQETEYVFTNNIKESVSKRTKLFVEAVLESKLYDISTVVLIGTRTSSWGALIDKNLDKDLWDELKPQAVGEQHQTVVVQESELADRIKKHIEKRWNVPFILRIHTDEIDENTSEQIFKIYSDLAPEIVKDNDILFDITHGFRSMPILLYQALQHSLTYDFAKKNVEIIYGEFKGNNKPASVRNLSNYWKYSQITDALKVFQNKLDGARLAELISDELPDVAKTINQITDIAQTNYSLHIKKEIESIKANLEKWFEKYTGNSLYISIKEVLKSFIPLWDQRKSKTIFNYAVFLKGKNLRSQSVIALEIAVETLITEVFGTEDDIGDYSWWKTQGTLYRDKLFNDEKWEMLGLLNDARNRIAHGGSKKVSESFISVEEIFNNFQKYKDTVNSMFSFFQNMSIIEKEEIKKRITQPKPKDELIGEKIEKIIEVKGSTNTGKIQVFFKKLGNTYVGSIDPEKIDGLIDSSLSELSQYDFKISFRNTTVDGFTYTLSPLGRKESNQTKERRIVIPKPVQKSSNFAEPAIKFDGTFNPEKYHPLKEKFVEVKIPIVAFERDRVIVNFLCETEVFTGIIPSNQYIMCGIKDDSPKDIVEANLHKYIFKVAKIKEKGIYLDWQGLKKQKK